MKKIVIILAVTALLGACSGMKKTLGIEKEAPDEFMVMSRAPLSLPPEYNLRPVNDPSQVSDFERSGNENLSSGERALLSKIQ